jgi:hypothetical protein
MPSRRAVLTRPTVTHEPLKWLMTPNEKVKGMHARWAHILSEYDFEVKHRPGLKSADADGLSRNPLQDETGLTDTRMDHDAAPVSPFSVSAGLALLAGVETENVSAADQHVLEEEFALAIPDKPLFAGTEKDGELLLTHPKANSVSPDIWLDPGTLQYLRDKSFMPGATAQERDRVQHRAKGYYFLNDLLRKRTNPALGKIGQQRCASTQG